MKNYDAIIFRNLLVEILAYHIVNIVQYKLRKEDESIRWTTFLDDMNTHTIGTVNYEDITYKKNSIRVVDQTTTRQLVIYKKL